MVVNCCSQGQSTERHTKIQQINKNKLKKTEKKATQMRLKKQQQHRENQNHL